MALREKNMWASQMGEVIEAVRLLSRSNGATINELSEELGVDQRTVKRLKKTLAILIGGPLDEIKGLQRETRFKFPSGFTLSLPLTNQSGLETPELMALYALRMNSGLFRGSDISSDIDKAFSKIGKALSPATRSMLERYANIFISVPKTPKDYSAHAETIEELSLAILGRTTCRICYTSFSEEDVKENSYEINPLNLFERDGGLYVFVVVTRFNDIRLLAVERIKQIDLTEKTFEWPENFDPEALLSKAFGLYWDEPFTAKIRFPASQARYIRERKWAEQQHIDELSDGSIVLTMDTSGRYDVKRWVLSFGVDAELLEPKDLRKEIKMSLKENLGRY